MLTSKKRNIINIENLILFAASLNFLMQGSLLFVVFIFIWIIRNFNTPLLFNAQMLILICLFTGMIISILLFGQGKQSLFETIKACIYIGVYFCGYNTVYNETLQEKYIEKIIFVFYFSSLLYLILIFLYNLSLGFQGGRVLYNIWTRQPVSVTLIGAVSSLIIAVSIYICFAKKLIYKVLSIIAWGFVLYLNGETATRTPWILSFVSLMVALIIFILKKRKYLFGVLSFFVIGGIIGSILLLYNLNENFYNFLNSIPVVNRILESGLSTSRVEETLNYISGMFNFLWGGNVASKQLGTILPHDIWLEMYDTFGFLASISLIIITVDMVIKAIELMKNKYSFKFSFMIIIFYFTLILQCALEPLVSGSPIIIWQLLFLHGLICRYIREKNEDSILQ